jgi:pimeloyl-ACP methyl ester carboxylesterase
MEKMYEERFVVAADGIRLYCRDYPNPSARPPVLCLPVTRNSRDFSMLAGRLSATRRVICPDLRGRGNSEYDPDWRNYHPGRYSEDLWQLLDELDVAETVVIGTSLGGWMAMLLNHQRPGRIAAAVMNDIGPEADPGGIARVTSTAGRLEVVSNISNGSSTQNRSIGRWMTADSILILTAISAMLHVKASPASMSIRGRYSTISLPCRHCSCTACCLTS